MGLRVVKIVPVVGLALAALLGSLISLQSRGVKAAVVSETHLDLFNDIVTRVETTYYKPVQTGELLAGERTGLIGVIKAQHASPNALPTPRASGQTESDNVAMAQLLSSAMNSYQAKISAQSLTEGAIRGLLASLHDPYSTYMDPHEFTSLEEMLKGGDFGGIGVYIGEDAHGNVLVAPIDGAPAARAGMKPGDLIVAVDSRPVHGMKLDSVEHLIRGKVGTSVLLTVKSDAKARTTRQIRVVREQIHVPSVHAKIEGDIDYIRLNDFGETSGDEVRKALLEGQRHHVRGYVLDLRYNGGGLVDAAVAVSSLVIPRGPIVSILDRFGDRDTSSALGTSLNVKPLVVLVNRFSASASEITAGAIQDYHLGTLIGTKTYGKGVVQSIFSLSNKGALKVTTARYITPAGRDIQHKGILPNIIIDQPDDFRYIDSPRDRQLAAAKALLHREAKP